MSGSFSNVDHSSGSWGGSVSGAVDLRPLLVAIRDLSEAVRTSAVLPSDHGPIQVTSEPAVINVSVPEQAVPEVKVTLPEMEPIIHVKVPEMPAPQITVVASFPVSAFLVSGILNIITLSALVYLVLSWG